MQKKLQKDLPTGRDGLPWTEDEQLSIVKQSSPGDRGHCILGAVREIRVMNSQNAGAKGSLGFFNPMVLNLPKDQDIHGNL